MPITAGLAEERVLKKLKIDFKQCCGCRRCEVACSLNHFENSVNPKKSRIRVMEEAGVFYPVVAGPFNNAECTSKNIFILEDKDQNVSGKRPEEMVKDIHGKKIAELQKYGRY